jgi:hypothetical protein
VFAPRGQSGVYLLQVHTATRATTVPFAVQGDSTRSVLVVLPVMTWQGRNPIDDDGDGLPNLLDRGVGAKLNRVYAGDGLPSDFAARDATLLTWLDRHHHRYDVTTDVALAQGQGPATRGPQGRHPAVRRALAAQSPPAAPARFVPRRRQRGVLRGRLPPPPGVALAARAPDRSDAARQR